MSKLVISTIGPASSVQDGGRHGAQRYGLTQSGAMDALALAAANCLAGNALFAAATKRPACSPSSLVSSAERSSAAAAAA